MNLKINNFKDLEINFLNARVLNLQLKNVNVNEIREQWQEFGHVFITDKIVGLDFLKKKLISIGDIFTVDGIKFVVNKIKNGNNYNYFLIETEFNKSTFYLLPFIADNDKYAGNYLINYCLYNTYLYWDKYPQYNNGEYLYLCYKFFNNDVYKKLELNLMEQKNIVDIINIDSTFTMFILKLNNPNLKHFLNGDYHKYDKQSKLKIVNFFNPTNNTINYKDIYSRVVNVLNNDKNKIQELELKLDINLPDNMNFESKPLLEDETCRM